MESLPVEADSKSEAAAAESAPADTSSPEMAPRRGRSGRGTLELKLMSRAYQEGVLPREYGPRHHRWLPEWDAYSAADKKAADGSA
jgi:hypothetical protein